MSSPDRRGGMNMKKTSDEELRAIDEFLNLLPKYRSHYTDSKKLYFDNQLTLTKLYELYKENQSEQDKSAVSYAIFVKRFKNYNVGIYIPKKDTCNKCDELKIKLQSTEDEEQKHISQKLMEEHQKRAQDARKLLQDRSKEAKNNGNLLSFSYDLQKTQPIPYLNTNRAYYTRQLSLFNLGINRFSDNKGYMCIWHEGEGKRGSTEVASCILEFLKNNPMSEIKQIHTFSDSCGGQNRNKNMIAFKMWCCHEFQIDEWQHSYMESGHSFLPNDQNFGKIELRKKRSTGIHTMKEWKEIIATSQTKNKFNVLEMKNKFINVSTLTASRKFNQKNDRGQKFSFLDLKWFSVKKDSNKFRYRNSNSESAEIQSIEFPCDALPDLSWMNYDLKISNEKRKDLISLLPYMSVAHHNFFKELKYANADREDETDLQ